jgi:hypothetical protein
MRKHKMWDLSEKKTSLYIKSHQRKCKRLPDSYPQMIHTILFICDYSVILLLTETIWKEIQKFDS